MHHPVILVIRLLCVKDWVQNVLMIIHRLLQVLLMMILVKVPSRLIAFIIILTTFIVRAGVFASFSVISHE